VDVERGEPVGQGAGDAALGQDQDVLADEGARFAAQDAGAVLQHPVEQVAGGGADELDVLQPAGAGSDEQVGVEGGGR